MSTIMEPGNMFPNPDQPRQHFDPVALRELAGSIEENGLVQPIAVTGPLTDEQAWEKMGELSPDIRQYVASDARYMIIAGERRWRALCLLRDEDVCLLEIPVIVRNDLSEQDIFELSLIENVNREDMLPMEEANAFGKMRDEYGLSTGEIARRVGRSPDFVRGRLALLDLDPDIQALVNGSHLPLTVAISISRLSSDKQHRVVQLMNEDDLNAMQACFLSDKMYAEQEQGELFDLGAYMQELAAEEAAKWLAKAQGPVERVKTALTTAIEQLGLPELEAHAAEVQERIKDLLTPKPGEFELCPGCRFYGSCHKEGDEATLDGKACFEEAPPTLAELVEQEAEKEKQLDYLISHLKGKAVTDQVKVFVTKTPTNHEALEEGGAEAEKDHHLTVVVKRKDDVLLRLLVAEQESGTADIYLDLDYGVGDTRWDGITFAMEHQHRYHENYLEGGTLLYEEVEEDG